MILLIVYAREGTSKNAPIIDHLSFPFYNSYPRYLNTETYLPMYNIETMSLPPPQAATLALTNDSNTNDLNDMSNRNALMIPKASRFQFAADKAPTELENLEKETRRKREEYRERVKGIDNRIAQWTCSLAQENMNRNEAHVMVSNNNIDAPLQECIEDSFDKLDSLIHKLYTDTSINDQSQASRTTSAPPPPPLKELESKVLDIETSLLYFLNRTVHTSIASNLIEFDQKLTNETANDLLQLEYAKADKRESSIIHKFESVVSRSESLLLQEEAEFGADLEMLKQEFQSFILGNGCRNEGKQNIMSSMSGNGLLKNETNDGDKINNTEGQEFYLAQGIHDLQKRLKQEKKERQIEDGNIIESIIRNQEMVQQSVLASVTSGGGSS